MANVENNNRIAEFVKKHVYAKRWISIMLVIALLVTTVTMYALNKSATAVSEETAETVGMVVDTADASEEADTAGTGLDTEEAGESENENEDGVAEEAAAADETSDEASEGSEEADTSDTENTEDADNSESGESSSEDSENVENTENSENSENSENADSNDSSSEESTDTSSDESSVSSEEDTTDAVEPSEETDASDETLKTSAADDSEEDSDEKEKTEETEETSEEVEEETEETTELTQDVILTVSYKNEDGENIADEKEIALNDSIDFTESAPEQEGYVFKNAKIEEKVITKITVKRDDNDFKFYEVTLEDGLTEEVKKDSTVVLTYSKEVIAKSEIKLTAKFADKNGESIKEDAELSIAEELDVTKKENVDAIENYFYMNASYNGQKIAKIAPVAADKTEAETAEQTEETEESKTESEEVSSYNITTIDGTEVSVEEDAEIVFTYYKAIETTEFVSTNDKVTVTATLSAPGAFPEGTELKVTEVNAETAGYNYEAYMQALNDNAEKIAKATEGTESAEPEVYDETNTILYDIAFMLEGVEYQPANSKISISIKFNNKQLSEELEATADEQLTFIHLPITESAKQDVDSTSEATDISADDIEIEVLNDSEVELKENKEEVSFEVSSLSIIGAHKVKTGSTWDGDTVYTAEQIALMLGDMTYFGAVARDFRPGGHFQANVAVQELNNIGQIQCFGNDAQVLEHVKYYQMTVTKTVTGTPKKNTFYFALYSDDKGTKKISGSDFSITTDQNGVGTYTTSIQKFITDGKGTTAEVYVFELSGKNGTPLKSGAKLNTTTGSYTVSYGDYTPISGGNDILGRFSSNYIESINVNTSNAKNNPGILLKQLYGNKLYVKNTGINGYDEYVYHTDGDIPKTPHKNEEFPVDIAGWLKQAANVSSTIAMAKSEWDENGEDIVGDVYVVNMIPANTDLMTDLTKLLLQTDQGNAAVNEPGLGNIGDDTLLLINLDLTGKTTYTLSKFRVNNQETGGFNDISNQIVVNPVKKVDGSFVPYDGELILNDSSGTVIAPKAQVKVTTPHCGTIIADSLETSCEFHKITIRRFLKVQGQAAVYNKNENTPKVNIELTKNWVTTESKNIAKYLKGAKFNKRTVDKNINVAFKLFRKSDGSNEYIEVTDIKNPTITRVGNKWTYRWSNLPEPSGFKYYVKEVTTPANFTSDSEYAEVIFNNASSTGTVVGNATINNTEKIPFDVFKFLNDKDPKEKTFTFTLQMLHKTRGLITLYEGKSIHNVGNKLYVDNEPLYINPAELDMEFGYDEKNEDHTYYFSLQEVQPTNSTDNVIRDKTGILIKVKYYNDGEIYYYRASEEEIKNLTSTSICDDAHRIKTDGKDKLHQNVAFYNTDGVGDLRIHKMVVNDYGSDFVRDSQNSILNNVWFRITNKATGNYIVFKGFTGHAGDTGEATEYDKSGNEVKHYEVVYNQSAQWTIKSIPTGVYTVDEVADGYTFVYNSKSNTSTIKDDQPISRITKYDYTVDDEPGPKDFEYGGQNLRKVFSVDCKNKSDNPPQEIVVGGELSNTSNTPTVQVANYYSNPIGPIQITKNFSGGEWTENMKFTFTIEAAGFSQKTSEGDPIPTGKQPMPQKVTKYKEGDQTKYKIEEITTVTVDGKDAVLKDGVYSKVVDFGSIPFRFEGTYKYKITETKVSNEIIDGVTYDDHVYYVNIVVSKKYTTFTKKYTYSDLSNPMYPQANDGIYLKTTEDFYYLGADIVYTDADGKELAKCSVLLEEGVEPDTVNYENNKYSIVYSLGSVSSVAFNNYMNAKLVIQKLWTKGGKDDTNNPHSEITVELHKVTGTTDETVGTYLIGAETKEYNNTPWTKVVLVKSDANSYYYIKETSGGGLIVTYSNGSTNSATAEDVRITATATSTGALTFTVTNEVGDNVLPSTGGSGTMPFALGGFGIAMIGLLGLEMSRRKRR